MLKITLHRLPRSALLVGIAMLATTACSLRSFSSGASAAEIFQNCKTDEERERLREERHRLIPRMIYYGKVVDMQGNPIPGATVNISRYSFGAAISARGCAPVRTTLKTDKNGCFKKWNINVWRFFADASKEGYAEERSLNPGDFKYYPWHSKKDPVVITLRKKEPETFLVISPPDNNKLDIAPLFKTPGTNSVSQPFDILSWGGDRKWRDSVTTNADLQIDAAFDAARQCWNVTYAVTNGAKGLILSDTMLYEAPETGYSPSATFSVTNQEQDCYVYVKSREPLIYSRLLFGHMFYLNGGQSLRLYCKVWVNPYGERSLEYDERIDSAFFLADTLRKEALEAFAAGRYPEKKKDMGKLAEETRERVLREAEEKNKRNREFQEQQRKLREAKNK